MRARSSLISRYKDLKFAHHVGGIRPQLIDKDHRRLMMGEAKIDTGVGAVFNMTPSPGATCCLENAEIDMRKVAEHLGATVDEDALYATCWSMIAATRSKTCPRTSSAVPTPPDCSRRRIARQRVGRHPLTWTWSDKPPNRVDSTFAPHGDNRHSRIYRGHSCCYAIPTPRHTCARSLSCCTRPGCRSVFVRRPWTVGPSRISHRRQPVVDGADVGARRRSQPV